MMRKNAFTKDSLRQIKNTLPRFLSILVLSALGTAFLAGLKVSGPDMKLTAEEYFKNNHMMDLELRSAKGFTASDINLVSKTEGVAEVMPAYSLDGMAKLEDQNLTVKLISGSFRENTINTPRLVSGRFPQKDGEVLADAQLLQYGDYVAGDSITFESGTDIPITQSLKQDTYTITGFADSPEYITTERGMSTVGSGRAQVFFILPESAFALPVFTNLYLQAEKEGHVSRFSKEYEESITKLEDRLRENVNWYVLDQETNIGFISINQDTKRLVGLSNVLPLLFFLVAVLVTMTSMTRLVDSDRIFIGTYKALGMSKFRIALRYLFYATGAAFLGSIIGISIGIYLIPTIVYEAYGILYILPSISLKFYLRYALFSGAAAIICAALPAFFVCLGTLRRVPAGLLRSEAPRIGKNTLIERIPFLWKHLSFTKKVSLRNLFRFKKRLIMTLIGVAGCTALLFTGFGIRSATKDLVPEQFGDILRYDLQIDLQQTGERKGAVEKRNLEDTLQQDRSVSSYMEVHTQAMTLQKGEESQEAIALIPQEDEKLKDFITLRNRSSQKSLSLTEEGIILTEKLSILLGVRKGDSVILNDTDGGEYIVRVAGITENYLNHYIYMSHTIYQKIFGISPITNQYLCHLNLSNTENTAVNEESFSENLLKNKLVSAVTYTENTKNSAKTMVNALGSVVMVLIISAAMLVFVVIFCLTSINIEERNRELATLKVLGFYQKELAEYIYRENILLTVIGTIIGLGLGVLLQRYIILTMETDNMMFARSLPWQSFVYSIGLTILFTLLVDVIMLRSIRKVDMVSSLKSIE